MPEGLGKHFFSPLWVSCKISLCGQNKDQRECNFLSMTLEVILVKKKSFTCFYLGNTEADILCPQSFMSLCTQNRSGEQKNGVSNAAKRHAAQGRERGGSCNWLQSRGLEAN